jgi:O-methyltransferase involved in polyketide biosynthesis
MINQTLNGIPETMLVPLWARAVETRREEPIIRDEQAVLMVGKIDYDFSKFDKVWLSQVGVAIRTELLDKAVIQFINNHPDAVVVNLGCGLDTRFSRLDNGRICWYDLDLPEPMRIRRQFFSETSRYRMIEKSIFDADWLDAIDYKNAAVLLIAEGIFMYFSEAEIKGLFTMLINAFPQAEMLLEVLAPVAVNRSQHHDAVSTMNVAFQWGAADGKTVEVLHPQITMLQEWNYFDYHRRRWGWLRWPARIPAFKRYFNNKIVHLRFV